MARVFGDRAIHDADDDRFGRAPFAHYLADQIASLPKGDSHVLALTGSWGSGKTSIIHMMAARLRERHLGIVPVFFNPWLFSGAEQLVANFFDEIGAQLHEKKDDRLSKLGTLLSEYGEEIGRSILAPLPIVGLAGGFFGKLMKASGGGLGSKAKQERASVKSRRDRIEALLEKSEARLLIIIDDLDRLAREEIREIMRLVRLVADFPNVSYLLAFDHDRVTAALSSQEGIVDGAEYLEKIVQLTFEVPFIRRIDLLRHLTAEVENTVSGLVHAPLEKKAWDTAIRDVLSPLLSTPRDVTRIANTLGFAVGALRDEVALVDIVVLEAVRVLLPSVFEKLPGLFDPLTNPSEKNHLKAAELVDQLAAVDPARRHVVERFLACTFPASRNVPWNSREISDWKRERRVASKEIFDIYLSKNVPTGAFSAQTIKSAVDALNDGEKLTLILGQQAPAALEALFEELVVHEPDFSADAAEIAIPIVYASANRLHDEHEALYGFGEREVVARLVYSLMRSIPSKLRANTARSICSRINLLSLRVAFCEVLQQSIDNVEPFVDKRTMELLAQELKNEATNRTSEDLRREYNLYRVVKWLHRFCLPPDEITLWIRGRSQDPGVLKTLLRSSLSGTADADSVVKDEDRLPWSDLEAILAEQREAISKLSYADLMEGDERTRAAVDLARRHIFGEPKPPEQDLGNVPAEELKHLQLLRSGTRQQREAAYSALWDNLHPSQELLAFIEGDPQPLAWPTQVALSTIAAEPRYPLEERCAAVRVLRDGGLDMYLRRAIGEVWIEESPMKRELSEAFATMWLDEAHLPELLSAISALPSASDPWKPVSPGVRAAFAQVMSVLRSRGTEVNETTLHQMLDVLKRFTRDPTLAQLMNELQKAFTLDGPGEDAQVQEVGRDTTSGLSPSTSVDLEK